MSDQSEVRIFSINPKYPTATLHQPMNVKVKFEFCFLTSVCVLNSTCKHTDGAPVLWDIVVSANAKWQVVLPASVTFELSGSPVVTGDSEVSLETMNE